MRSLQPHELALSFTVGVAVLMVAPYLVAALAMTAFALLLSIFAEPPR